MPNNQNPDLVRAFCNGAKIQILEVPSRIAESIVPVLDVTPRNHRVSTFGGSASIINGTSQNIIAAPATNVRTKLYITSAAISWIKDVTSTATVASINITMSGFSARIISLAGITLTAGSDSTSLSFPIPIEVDNGTNITLTSDTGVANIQIRGSITGYYVQEL
jgi:hypothetical protein